MIESEGEMRNLVNGMVDVVVDVVVRRVHKPREEGRDGK
jgi:hypothetical protein